MDLLAITGFHVFVAVPGKRDRKVRFVAGDIIRDSDIPAGHSAQAWIEKGLAVAASPDGAGSPAPEAGPAV